MNEMATLFPLELPDEQTHTNVKTRTRCPLRTPDGRFATPSQASAATIASLQRQVELYRRAFIAAAEGKARAERRLLAIYNELKSMTNNLTHGNKSM